MDIAVHSGHHNSVAVLLDGSRIRAVAAGGSLNYHSNKGAVVRVRLTELLQKLTNGVLERTVPSLLAKCDRMAFSLPGVSTGHDQTEISKIVKAAGWKPASAKSTFFADDTWTGLLAGTLSSKGICAFAGTGASVYVGTMAIFTKGKPYKFDGWGPLLGDFGSGFHLGLLALQHASRYFDANQAPSPIQIAMAQIHRELAHPERLQAWIDHLLKKDHSAWRLAIAALAKIVTPISDRHDPAPEVSLARQLVAKCAQAMSATINDAIRRFRSTHTSTLIWQGGMFRHCPYYRQQVADAVEMDLSPPRYLPIVGTLLLLTSPDFTFRMNDRCDRLLANIADLPGPDRRFFTP